MIIYIVMGVSGCGKSTVGREAARRLGMPFLEGDDFHSRHNIEKMSAGLGLTDDDRMPWVDAMVEACKATVQSEEDGELVLACSALSKVVRQRLRAGLGDRCQFIHLHGDQALLFQRLSGRKGHFFKPELLESQFAALDMPLTAHTLDIDSSVEALVAQLCEIVRTGTGIV